MTTSQIPCPGGFLYTVRSGDTLFEIARRYGLTLDVLLSANPDLDPAQNPGVNPNKIAIGQQVCVPVPTECTGIIYTIMPGDTLYALAAHYDTTVDAILAANPGLDPNRLLIGQQICIPVKQPVCTGFQYTVTAGDTLYSLANRYGTTVQAILAVNPGLDPNRLVIGQQICIPVQKPACPGFQYTVMAGDTIYSLANRYGTTVQAILAVNPGIDPNRLVIGQQICIPVPQPACTGFIYTVAAGDTLFNLAKKYGATVDAILAANPGLTPERLAIGQRICIPVMKPEENEGEARESV